MKIKDINIEGFAALAPMAGVADRAVREVARKYGVAYTVGEMTSAKGIAMGSAKSAELLEPDDAHPYAIQLFGCDLDCLRLAAEKSAEQKPDIIDINMGCPAPKITNGGSGSALLKDLPLARKVIESVVAGANGVAVTVKIRQGFDFGHDVAVEAAKMAEQAGASAITVHARTRAQMYTPPIDINCITRVKQAVSIPVIGNGDIFTPQDALNMFETTGCDLVMIGRGALGNPFIFSQVNALMRGEEIPAPPPLDERFAVMKEELSLLIKYKGDYVGYREARKHTSWYMTGLHSASKLRKMCGEILTWEDIEEICRVAVLENIEEI